ncbi:DUF6308 family protein [Arthrobacter psychrochitiniphilus]|uniref:DUF6308 family protein n=1 Tax=Arthrobacter psychrochitiniphilus TaxID=291045 RepID=UPI003F7C4A20
MKLPMILDAAHIDQAAELVEEYYTKTYKRGEIQTGARFESWAGGGDAPEVVNTITADDLIAVGFLSVEVPAPAAIGILETHKAKISELLIEIPADLDLASVSTEKFASTLGQGSAAIQLWRILRQSDAERWDVGPTKASKIMARKRPRLIPIYDSVISSVMEMKNSDKQWITWHELLTDGSGLPERLKEIQEKAGVAPDASALRIMDVVLWKHGKDLLQTKTS